MGDAGGHDKVNKVSEREQCLKGDNRQGFQQLVGKTRADSS